MSERFVMCIALIGLCLTGCMQQAERLNADCPGKVSAQQALEALSQHKSPHPFKANGHLFVQFVSDNKDVKQNIPVKLWGQPPANFYAQGNIAFDAKAVVAGANEDEFWFSVRLKEISTYCWGKWAEQADIDISGVSLGTLLEIFNIVIDRNHQADIPNWSLSREGVFDVLTEHNAQGSSIRKLYVYRCDYLVRKIEYLDADGRIVATAQMSMYKRIADGFWVPAVIKIRSIAKKDGDNLKLAKLRLNSIRPTQLIPEQRKRLFSRPDPRGFEHIYRIAEDGILEVP
ncbi:MAG: hypothetical protein JXB29_03955 [Sedimentisphaerales bacterium]|nr:hypothetical protein [Sedimentisphaerales bacterium]